MCYEISPDSLLLKTNADVKKLKEHDASKKTSKSGKASESPKMNAVKKHILCFCYQFNCTNCPICPSSPHNRSTCNCEVCECKCKASYPLNQRDRIELELHPPVRETITTSLLQRAIEILPPASVNDGILNMNNQLTMDHSSQSFLLLLPCYQMAWIFALSFPHLITKLLLFLLSSLALPHLNHHHHCNNHYQNHHYHYNHNQLNPSLLSLNTC